MFSVIIPAFNCEKTIYRTLDSVVNQTRVDLIDEVIIINDGSYDNTDIIIRDYIKEHNVISFKYLSQQNHGVAFTRNYGIRQAVGKWIALLDSDDIWLPRKLERQYDEISRNPNIVFLGSACPLKKGLKNYTDGLYKLTAKELCIRNLPSTPSVVFLRDVGMELGLYDETMCYGEDINFFQKFLLKDSYYIIAEKLIEISIGKTYFAESGLSSNLYKMHKGRNRNTIELCEMGLISKTYKYFMLAFNQIKLIRRGIIYLVRRTLYKKSNNIKGMFSVVMLAYNCENTITQSLDSVMNQTRGDLIEEIIIVNDGSTDSTDEVISKYSLEHLDININYIRQGNHGVSHARNTGIMCAKSEWIALLNSNDVWMPNQIERQYEELQIMKQGDK